MGLELKRWELNFPSPLRLCLLRLAEQHGAERIVLLAPLCSADLPGVDKCCIVTHLEIVKNFFQVFVGYYIYIYIHIFYSPIVLVNKMDIY